MMRAAFVQAAWPTVRCKSSRSLCTKQLPQARLFPAWSVRLAAIPTIPLVAFSEATLLRTGCGLPPGPAGTLGAAEGLSYLIIAAVAIRALVKVLTKDDEEPLLEVEKGAALVVLLGILAAAYTVSVYGSLPPAVPVEGGRCFAV